MNSVCKGERLPTTGTGVSSGDNQRRHTSSRPGKKASTPTHKRRLDTQSQQGPDREGQQGAGKAQDTMDVNNVNGPPDVERRQIDAQGEGEDGAGGSSNNSNSLQATSIDIDL